MRTAAWLTLGLLAGTAAAAPPDEFFERDVRPRLVAHCETCHGPDKQKGGVRLDSREAVLTGGGRGPAAVPGKRDESRLIAVINHGGELKMPPTGKLPDRDIATLTRWVELGLPW